MTHSKTNSLPALLKEMKERCEAFSNRPMAANVHQVEQRLEETQVIAYYLAENTPRLIAALEKAISQRDYVADYPISGPEAIEEMNSELASIIAGESK